MQKYLISSNFWSLIEPTLLAGSIYIGSSAGAIVAGMDISPAFWKGWDDPGAAEGVEWNSTNLRGRCIVPYSIFPHYDADKHLHLVESKRVELPHRVRCIPDDVALICSNEGEEYAMNVDGQIQRSIDE